MTKEQLEAIKRRQEQLDEIEKDRGLTFIEASENLNLAGRAFLLTLLYLLRVDKLYEFLDRQLRRCPRFYRILVRMSKS